MIRFIYAMIGMLWLAGAMGADRPLWALVMWMLMAFMAEVKSQ